MHGSIGRSIIFWALMAIGCSSGPVPDSVPASEAHAEDSSGQAGALGPYRRAPGSRARLIPLGRFEGYGNPSTGELWSRLVPADKAQQDADPNVHVSAQALSGYCPGNVVNDGVVNSNPAGTFEFYTQDKVPGAPATELPSFDATTCFNRLQPSEQTPLVNALFQPTSAGVGCAHQHVGNFSGVSYTHVYMDVDVFNGDETKHGPYGVGFTTGTAASPGGRHSPNAVKGLWDFGAMADGTWKDMWIYFKDGDDLNFNFTGFLLGEVAENCGDALDNDCDGIVNNDCNTFTNGSSCYSDADCVSGLCVGENITSGYGVGGTLLSADTAGTCQPSNVCGNSNVEIGETCDDGNATTESCAYGQTSCTVCNSSCVSVAGATDFCGDGVTDAGETCDDGNAVTEACAYGQTSCTVCSSSCQSVAGATDFCGDGVIDAGESCDDSNTTTEVCAYGLIGCTVCNATCALVAGVTSLCGDSAVNPGETCDDGNATTEACDYGQTSCTVCAGDCKFSAGATSYCGNDAKDSGNGEGCDDGNTITETCAYGLTNCTVCSATCNEVSGAASYCGDNVTNFINGEGCDDGNTTTEACGYGLMACAVCSATCTLVAGATSFCGDNVTNFINGEGCDDGNTTTEACAYGQMSCLVCGASCSLVAGATSYCSDGIIDGSKGEACDDGNLTTEACAYGQTSCTVCNSSCASVAGATAYCGNGITNGANGEACDDGNTTTEACAYGQMSCTVCGASCGLVAGATSFCGDGITDGSKGENCDDGNANAELCAYGLMSCTVCGASCTMVAGATRYCGDGTPQGGFGEACDDGDQTNGNGCDNNCTLTACGNGIVTGATGEECDDGNVSNGDSCPSDCTFNECVGEGGGNNCDTYATCTDTNPSFMCKCNSGFVGAGTTNNCNVATRVFTSAGVYPGNNFGSAAGADTVCQSLASSSGLGGSWKAWVSDSLSSPSTRFWRSGAPYVLLNGSVIAPGGYPDLVDESDLLQAINIDQYGATIGANFDVWTGTTRTGKWAGAGGNDCSSWTSGSAGTNGAYGAGQSTVSTSWSQTAVGACNTLKRVHCFEQDVNQSARVFVSSAIYTGNLGGPAGADSICQNLAVNAGRVGRWKAWISDGSTSPFTRFSAAAVPYTLLDGAKTTVAQYWSWLTYQPLQSAINVNEYGGAVGSPFDVWTGTNANGTGTANHCNGWTDGASASGTFGYGETTTTWSVGSLSVCSAMKRIYCMEQVPGSPAPQTPLRTFVTSASYASSFGGTVAADATCQNVANGQSLGGFWRAWLSTTANPVTARFTRSTRPYIVLNGVLIANDWSELVLYTDLWAPINRTQTGAVVGSTVNPWTGTRENGSYDTGFSCTDWTSTSAGLNGSVGTTAVASFWSSGYTSTCNATRPLYCFEQGPAPAAKRVFVTSTFYNGQLGGIAGADAKCQARAAAASLGGTWLAWVSSSTGGTPVSRFTWHGPYATVTGTPVANSWSDLTDGTLINAINKTELGGTVSVTTWTGTNNTGGSTGVNCTDWTSFSMASSATQGSATSAASAWTNLNSDVCSNAKSLYCFEQ